MRQNLYLPNLPAILFVCNCLPPSHLRLSWTELQLELTRQRFLLSIVFPSIGLLQGVFIIEDPSNSLAMCWLLGILVHPKKGSSLPPLVGRTAEACACIGLPASRIPVVRFGVLFLSPFWSANLL